MVLIQYSLSSQVCNLELTPAKMFFSLYNCSYLYTTHKSKFLYYKSYSYYFVYTLILYMYEYLLSFRTIKVRKVFIQQYI